MREKEKKKCPGAALEPTQFDPKNGPRRGRVVQQRETRDLSTQEVYTRPIHSPTVQ